MATAGTWAEVAAALYRQALDLVVVSGWLPGGSDLEGASCALAATGSTPGS